MMQAVGIEREEEVAERARGQLKAAGLTDRVLVVAGDVRSGLPTGPFDLCLLNNNLYYLPPLERPALLQSLYASLAPGGVLALQVPVLRRTRDPQTTAFHLYCVANEGTYALPSDHEVVGLLQTAGFGEITGRPLWWHGSWYYYFTRRLAASA